MDTVLVLNANYQPINICSTRRAFNLIFASKASLVKNGRGYFNTVTQTFPIPSVIRLEKIVIRPRLKVPLSRVEVFRRDHYTCQYCGKQNVEFSIDHVIPRTAGGQNTWTNIVTCCVACNRYKGNRTPHQAQMHLIRVPAAPPSSAAYFFGQHHGIDSGWDDYLKGW